MPDWLARLTSNPVAFIGVLRAIALAVMGFVPTLFTNDQLDAVFYALSLLLPFVSMLFTGASSSANRAQVEEARREVPEGYVPEDQTTP